MKSKVIQNSEVFEVKMCLFLFHIFFFSVSVFNYFGYTHFEIFSVQLHRLCANELYRLRNNMGLNDAWVEAFTTLHQEKEWAANRKLLQKFKNGFDLGINTE